MTTVDRHVGRQEKREERECNVAKRRKGKMRGSEKGKRTEKESRREEAQKK